MSCLFSLMNFGKEVIMIYLIYKTCDLDYANLFDAEQAVGLDLSPNPVITKDCKSEHSATNANALVYHQGQRKCLCQKKAQLSTMDNLDFNAQVVQSKGWLSSKIGLKTKLDYE